MKSFSRLEEKEIVQPPRNSLTFLKRIKKHGFKRLLDPNSSVS
jgi:hypothetical protein